VTVPEQLVHVICPDGTRYQYGEREFPVGTAPEKILAWLGGIKRVFGTVRTVMRVDEKVKKDTGLAGKVPHPDPSSGWWWDHPDTVVAIGHDDGAGEFVEVSRIKGPPKPTEG